MTHGNNLLGEPPATFLPGDTEADGRLAAGEDPAAVAADVPAFSTAWADLADRAFEAGSVIESYAYARTGYHRGLDALRGSGWKGFGAVPWSHLPNRGWLRCVYALSRAATSIGESPEAARCAELLRDSDPEAADALAG